MKQVNFRRDNPAKESSGSNQEMSSEISDLESNKLLKELNVVKEINKQTGRFLTVDKLMSNLIF